MPAKRLDILAKEEEICNKYRTGSYASQDLADEYKCSKRLILNILKRHGIKLDKNTTEKIRTRKGSKNHRYRHGLWNNASEICKKYSEGTYTYKELAQEYNVSHSTMSRLINGQTKGVNNAHRNDLWDKAEEIYEHNKSGVSQTKLSKDYKCSRRTIKRIIGWYDERPQNYHTYKTYKYVSKNLHFDKSLKLVDDLLKKEPELDDYEIAYKTRTHPEFVRRHIRFLKSMSDVRDLLVVC